jgi:predicted DNA-binding transcriptional regulator AlpA
MHPQDYNIMRGESGLDSICSSRKLRAPAAAGYLGLSTSTLAKMRLRGDGPPYSKVGSRIVVYDRADLETWLAGRKRYSTSEAGEALEG